MWLMPAILYTTVTNDAVPFAISYTSVNWALSHSNSLPNLKVTLKRD